jgi:thiol-disulfide isomerase/thioredoxin
MAKKKKKRSTTGPQSASNANASTKQKKGYTAPKGTATKVRKAPPKPAKSGSRQWVMVGGIIGLIVAGVVGLAVVSSVSGGGTGVTAFAEWDLPVLDDETDADGRVLLAEFGEKPVVVNFFASWCTVCEDELPTFRDAADTLSDEVEFVFVNTNETGNWRPMAERTGILDQVIVKDIGGTQRNGLYRSLGGTGGMPMTAYYSAEGELLSIDRGGVSREALIDRLQRFYGVAWT